MYHLNHEFFNHNKYVTSRVTGQNPMNLSQMNQGVLNFMIGNPIAPPAHNNYYVQTTIEHILM